MLLKQDKYDMRMDRSDGESQVIRIDRSIGMDRSDGQALSMFGIVLTSSKVEVENNRQTVLES